ncbi:hypothetical protein ABWL43_27165 [Pseudomonas sp. HT11]|uniref:hypothetical protein n=1 Tax=Pseudomonas sp. HT11 TaxID=3230490 RepID=UPI003851781A
MDAGGELTSPPALPSEGLQNDLAFQVIEHRLDHRLHRLELRRAAHRLGMTERQGAKNQYGVAAALVTGVVGNIRPLSETVLGTLSILFDGHRAIRRIVPGLRHAEHAQRHDQRAPIAHP